MEVSLLKYSIEMLAPQKEAFGQSFYQHLFACDAHIQQFFVHTDMKRQECLFITTLEMIIAGLERGDNLAPALYALGQRHSEYGVQESLYPLLEKVLFTTLREYLGHAFTPQIQEAWHHLYKFIRTQMLASKEYLWYT